MPCNAVVERVRTTFTVLFDDDDDLPAGRLSCERLRFTAASMGAACIVSCSLADSFGGILYEAEATGSIDFAPFPLSLKQS